jgi:proteasome lid subunit RPN8/RPN11
MMSDYGIHIAAALAHAGECQPRESCGLIAGGNYVRLRNIETGFDAFALDMREFHQAARQRPVEAIVHSHVLCGPMASEADRAACDRIGLPFLIVSWPSGRWTLIEPQQRRAPLVGRRWQWQVHDCFTLVRDALDAYGGIRIPDYDRAWGFWERGEDPVGQAIAGSNFVILAPASQPQHLDVIGMRFRSPVINHLGIFLAPDRLLHQLMGQLSVRDSYSGFFQKITALHLRHARFLEEAPA